MALMLRSEGVEAVLEKIHQAHRGHASLAALPLLDEDQSLDAVLIFEDTTRTVLLTEENQALKLKQRRRKPA